MFYVPEGTLVGCWTLPKKGVGFVAYKKVWYPTPGSTFLTEAILSVYVPPDAERANAPKKIRVSRALVKRAESRGGTPLDHRAYLAYHLLYEKFGRDWLRNRPPHEFPKQAWFWRLGCWIYPDSLDTTYADCSKGINLFLSKDKAIGFDP